MSIVKVSPGSTWLGAEILMVVGPAAAAEPGLENVKTKEMSRAVTQTTLIYRLRRIQALLISTF
jgi:hypothetical protein